MQGAFGWNFTRGATAEGCSSPPCQAPNCYADFAFANVGFGITPWGAHTGMAGLPVDTSALDRFDVRHNVSWSWTDNAPGLAPPPTSANNSRRIRFIYDFFLTSEKPREGVNIAHKVTDEVTINLASEPAFPGSQPPGCLDPDSRFGKNGTYGPVVEKTVWDGSYWYDYYYTDHHDAVPGTGSRYSSFRRRGLQRDSQPPPTVNLIPFLRAIAKMWPAEPVGPWLGHISLATELYDHVSGNVIFHSPPSFTAQLLQSTLR
jgi:hypothetical protein